MENQGKVSVVIPIYNAEGYIAETIESVLNQDYGNWELLLVDDLSTDNSIKVMEDIARRHSDREIYILKQEENGGAARARNRGVEEAKGRYIAYLDADDIWEESKLSEQLFFMKEQNAAFSFTGYEFADENGVGTGKVVSVPLTISYKEALRNTTIFTTTVIFDTDLIAKEMLEMPRIKSEDTALWWKVLRNGYVGYGLNRNLARYRRAGKTLSSNKLEAIRRIWNLYRQAEGLSFLYSIYNFCFWALRAVKRRV